MSHRSSKGDSKPKKQKWYADGLRFECTQCGSCCSGAPGFVWVDPEEIQAMADSLGMELGEFRDRYIRDVDGSDSLREYDGGDCILLDQDTRLCTVYEGRPIQCRTWPFWDSNLGTSSDWKQTCRECPGAGKGTLYSFDQIEVIRRKKSV
jgi:uncharacterized protein